MSAADIKTTHQQSLSAGANGAQILANQAAAERILAAAGETIKPDELKALVAIFEAEVKNPGNDQAVVGWMQEQLDTIAQLDRYVKQVAPQVDGQKAEFDRTLALMMTEGKETRSLAGQTIARTGLKLPPELTNVPEETKKLLNKAVANGASYVDARALEQGQFGIDHGHIMPKGKYQRYPQWRALEDIYAVSRTLERDKTQAPDQVIRMDGLDPRATVLNGALAARMVNEKQTYNTERQGANGPELVRTTATWAEHALTDRDPDALTEEYDEKGHPDHLAWAPGNGPFASNAMIWLDGTLHMLRAPRRTYTDDRIGMGGGILTTGSLGRGFPGWFWGHVHGDVQKVPQDPNNPQSPQVDAFVVTYVGLSGMLCADVAAGDLKLPDPVALIKAQGLRTAPGLQVTFENAEHRQKMRVNPQTGLIEQK